MGLMYESGMDKEVRICGCIFGMQIAVTLLINLISNIIMVKSTPLLRKRILKKRTLKFTRFQSDLYAGRLADSWRRPRGSPSPIQALITACVVASEATRRCLKLATDLIEPRSISSPTD